MEFCPECGMRLKAVKVSDEPRYAIKCVGCNYESLSQEVAKTTAISVNQAAKHEEPIVVVDEQASKIKTLPTMKATCSQCGNDEAYVWMVQTRGADEASTQFFRCTRCELTWREYA